MNTWASATYSISSKSSVFINNVSLRIDEKSGMPIVQRKYPNDLKELERIEEGDVVYCFNNVFFSSFADYEAQTLTLARLLSSEKWFNLKLLDIHLLARQGVPRIEQIIIPDTRVTVRLSQFACSLSTCISSISSALYSPLSGSVLLAINDEVVVNKTHESILLLYQDVVPPVSLLLSCPYQFSLISPREITSFLSHASSVSISPSIPAICDDSPADASPQPFAVDAFMFPHSQGYAILERQWEADHATQTEIATRSWDAFLKRIGGVEKLRFAWTRQSGTSWSFGLSSATRHRRQLRALVRGGVPDALRCEVWFRLSGGCELQSRWANDYRQMSASQLDPKVRRMIDHDIPRTFPMHPLFCSGVLRSSDASKEVVREEAPLAASLRRVLLAISVLREDIGYCQGFNLLAGFLLIVMMDEEKVFWTLAGLLQYVFPSGYFDSSLSGARVDEAVFEEMLQKRMPRLYERITKADSALLSLSLGWFMNIFINYLPVTTVVRLWDVIMLEGDKCLLRFAMALLAMNEEELLQSEDDSVLSSRFRQMGQFLFDVDALLGLAYKKHNPLLGDTSFFPFKRMEIERMRETKRREILGKAVWASSTRVVIDSDD
ncbi:hypothetical protein WA538_001760, partial [Blastocystis sp. DL]